jgi:predicted metalloprotease
MAPALWKAVHVGCIVTYALFVGIKNAAAIIATDFIAHLSIEMIGMSIGMSFVFDDPEIKMTHSIVKIPKCERKRRRQISIGWAREIQIFNI